jgi:hypothetical protein
MTNLQDIKDDISVLCLRITNTHAVLVLAANDSVGASQEAQGALWAAIRLLDDAYEYSNDLAGRVKRSIDAAAPAEGGQEPIDDALLTMGEIARELSDLVAMAEGCVRLHSKRAA